MGGAPARRAQTPVGAHICHGAASSLLCMYTLLTGAAAHTWQNICATALERRANMRQHARHTVRGRGRGKPAPPEAGL